VTGFDQLKMGGKEGVDLGVQSMEPDWGGRFAYSKTGRDRINRKSKGGGVGKSGKI